MESSGLEYWPQVQLEPAAVDIAIKSSKIEFCSQLTLPSVLQNLRFGHRFEQSLELVTLPSSLQALSFGHSQFQPKPGLGDLAMESSKLEFWPQVQLQPAAVDLAIDF